MNVCACEAAGHHILQLQQAQQQQLNQQLTLEKVPGRWASAAGTCIRQLLMYHV
jgi:hypothetical protein